MSMIHLSFHDVMSVEIGNRRTFLSNDKQFEAVDIRIRMEDGSDSIVLIGEPGFLVSAAELEQTEETA